LSRLAEILSDKSSSSLEAETQSEASDPSDEKPTAARSGKMSAVGGDIRPFEGLNDGEENIKIFIDDVEFLAECHDRKAPASTKTMLRVFRRFLKGTEGMDCCFPHGTCVSWGRGVAGCSIVFCILFIDGSLVGGAR